MQFLHNIYPMILLLSAKLTAIDFEWAGYSVEIMDIAHYLIYSPKFNLGL